MKTLTQAQKETLDIELEEANNVRHKLELIHQTKVFDARWSPWIAVGFALPLASWISYGTLVILEVI